MCEHEDIVEVNDDRDVEEVLEDVIHKTLESGGSIRKSEGHYEPFEGSVFRPEGSFPFVAFRDADQMVRMTEIYLRIDPGLSGSVQEIGDERKRVVVLLRDAVQRAEVHAEAQGAILLLDEEDWSSVRRSGLPDETSGEVLVDELAKCFEFSRR